MSAGPGRGKSKYSDEQKAWIKLQWIAGQSSTDIAEMMLPKFGVTLTSKAIIGLVFRMKLPARPADGPWREAGWRRRNGHGTTARKPSKPLPAAPEPSGEEPARLGLLNDHPDTGCTWIYGDIRGQFQYCGQVQIHRKPYCVYHAAVAKAVQSKPMSGSSRAERQFRG